MSVFDKVRDYVKRAGRKAKRQVKATGRQLGKTHARALGIVLPIAGSLVAGPAGAALGTSLAYAGGRYWYAAYARGQGMHGRDAREWARNRSRQALYIGGAVTGVSLGLALAGGTPLYGSSITAFKSTFGIGAMAGTTSTTSQLGAGGATSGLPGGVTASQAANAAQWMSGGQVKPASIQSGTVQQPVGYPTSDDEWAAYWTQQNQGALSKTTLNTGAPGAGPASSFGKDLALATVGGAMKALEGTGKATVDEKDPIDTGQTGGGFMTDLLGSLGVGGGAVEPGGGGQLLVWAAIGLAALMIFKRRK